MSQYQCFLDDNALSINRARQEHLASLDLDINGRTVIEVGAGIGLHTQFFLDRGCDVTITDGALANVEEIQRRHPTRRSFQLDLESAQAIQHLGHWDICYCYGLLYHVGDPEHVLAMLGSISDTILLELICSTDPGESVTVVRDPRGLNQSTVGRGCRPSRAWIMSQLNKHWGHAYISRTQPDHPDFPRDWHNPGSGNTRAIFVGSRREIAKAGLVTAPLMQQEVYKKG